MSPHQQIKSDIRDMLIASEGKHRSTWDIADEALMIAEQGLRKIYAQNIRTMNAEKTGREWVRNSVWEEIVELAAMVVETA